ncbi:hypothetical protein K8089_10055 [Aequorivita sp. F47161]|uniref:Uncharacterized protein n=1 Tax=Aequorivita vitellina TaxID=2874475 RepID=A0A9X1QTV2_9FLAO|nr:hypothetical protein [Aequorivita vitellina]MCG2419366.1 hypothetical protein [Aequorivita vitellina]
MKKLKLEDLLEHIETSKLAIDFGADLDETSLNFKSLNLSNSDIVRIEEDVRFSWSGVTGCNSNDRAQSEYQQTLKAWVKNKLYEHRNWSWVRYGATEANGRCNSSKDPWTGVRRCGCSGKLKCYIEFRKS